MLLNGSLRVELTNINSRAEQSGQHQDDAGVVYCWGLNTNGQRLLVQSVDLEGACSTIIDDTLLDALQKGATLQFSVFNETASARVSVITLDTTFFAERAMCLELVDAVNYRENDSTRAFLRNGVFRAVESGR